MRQLTLQDMPVKQGRALSPTCERASEKLFLHEYWAEECSSQPLAAGCAPASCPPNQGHRADIIAWALAALSGSWESDATGGHCQKWGNLIERYLAWRGTSFKPNLYHATVDFYMIAPHLFQLPVEICKCNKNTHHLCCSHFEIYIYRLFISKVLSCPH